MNYLLQKGIRSRPRNRSYCFTTGNKIASLKPIKALVHLMPQSSGYYCFFFNLLVLLR
jgi:hypothetical protein